MIKPSEDETDLMKINKITLIDELMKIGDMHY